MLLNFNESSLEYNQVIPGALKITNENVSTKYADKGKLIFSWNDFSEVNLSNDIVLFTLEFRATTNNTISKSVFITSDITKAEAYTTNLSEINLGLEFRTNEKAVNGIWRYATWCHSRKQL